MNSYIIYLYETNNKEHQIIFEYLKIIIPCFVSLLGIIYVKNNVKKQIIATENNLKNEIENKRKEKFYENVSLLLTKISKEDRGKLLHNDYLDDEHRLLEKKIKLLIDRNNKSENELFKLINKIKFNNSQDIDIWIEKIEKIVSEIINNKQQ